MEEEELSIDVSLQVSEESILTGCDHLHPFLAVGTGMLTTSWATFGVDVFRGTYAKDQLHKAIFLSFSFLEIFPGS